MNIERLAHTALTTPNAVTKRQAKREMRRKYGYQATQSALTRVRKAMIILSS